MPCPHLQTSTGGCSIHAELEAHGQGGCAAYDCYGAGQRVTQELLPAARLTDRGRQARRLTQAFRTLYHVHELELLLQQAARLPLAPEHERERARLLDELEPPNMTEETLAQLDLDSLEDRVRRLLSELRAYFPEPAGGAHEHPEHFPRRAVPGE